MSGMRYVLIDYMHLVHKCLVAQPLSATVKVGDEIRTIDTTIPNYTIKNIFNYGGKGAFYTGVFFEGGRSFRKAYFTPEADGVGYKGNRPGLRSSAAEGANLSIELLLNGKVSLYRLETFEADDLIAAMIAKIKTTDTTTPIDVITNDSDLLPLVDEQVSVYIRGTREFACDGCPTRRLYYQVTPETWYDYLSYTSAYKKFYIPYNSMLLHKMIRGDSTDKVPAALKGYGGVKYSNLMHKMEEDGVDFVSSFKYGVDFNTVMKPILDVYFTEEEVARLKFNYDGLNMHPANVIIPKQIEPGYLQGALSPLKIRLSF